MKTDVETMRNSLPNIIQIRILALGAFLSAPMNGSAADIGVAGVLPVATIQQGIAVGTIRRLNALPRHGWRLLHCETGSCMMTPVIVHFPNKSSEFLEVRAELAKGRLPKGHESIALLHGNFPESSIRARFTPRTPRKADDVALGTVGVQMEGFGEPPYDSYRVLPRALSSVSETKEIQLYVETAIQRQSVMRLPVDAFFNRPKTRDFLRFAGDLDGDGKLDFIVVGPQTDDTDKVLKGDIDEVTSRRYEVTGFPPMSIRLYLSGKAKNGELLGLAAETRGWSHGVQGGEE